MAQVQVLERLFGSKSRVKILRFFLRNPELGFDLPEIARRTKVPGNSAKSEIQLLESVEFLIGVKKEDAKAKKTYQMKDLIFRLNPDFKLMKELESLVFAAGFIGKDELTDIINGVGKVKLAIISGVFLGNGKFSGKHSKIDLFLVVDVVDKSKLKIALQSIEAEIGKEIDYSLLTTEEFTYRKDMYDKFVHDILEGPREDLINKLRV